MTVSGRRDQRLRRLADAQHGYVARGQLLAAGLSYQAIGCRVRRGQLMALPGAVFALGSLPPSELGRAAAALLAVSSEAAISHMSAAMRWGMLGISEPTESVHVVAPLGSRRSIGNVVIHRTRSLPREDIRLDHGLPITSPARALLDIAELVSSRQLELAFDRALVARIIYRDDIVGLLARTRGRSGLVRLRRLLEREAGTAITRSHAEERFLALIRRAGLPAPQVNARCRGFEVDFLWPDNGLVVEIDGFRYHATRRAFEHDHRKDAVLRAAALEVLRFTPSQVKEDALAVVAQVTRGLCRSDRD